MAPRCGPLSPIDTPWLALTFAHAQAQPCGPTPLLSRTGCSATTIIAAGPLLWPARYIRFAMSFQGICKALWFAGFLFAESNTNSEFLFMLLLVVP